MNLELKTMELYKTEEYRGYKINIYYDYDAESPRSWDNLGTIYSNSRNYNPDNHKIEEILNDEKTGLSQDFKKNYIWLKIRGYEHGGLTISVSGDYSFNDPWDSGLFGIIAVSKKKATQWLAKKICTPKVRERALNCLRGEVKTLNMYYNGDVYGFQTENEEGDEIDSCWGFFGDDGVKEIIEEQKSVIDSDILKREEQHNSRIEIVKANITMLIGNVFPYANESFRISRDMFGFPVIQKATVNRGRLRDDFYKDIDLPALPEDVLANMAKLIA